MQESEAARTVLQRADAIGALETAFGLDISMDETNICVVDRDACCLRGKVGVGRGGDR